MTEILLPYGMRRGSLVHISSEDILSGLTDCTCPECGEHLVARKGDHNRHHFAHKGDAGRPINGRCRGGFETAAHLRAKEIIEEAGKIRFPDNMVWKLDRVWLEKKIQPSALRPDIIVSTDQRTAVIEIFVTNRCSPAKISLLKQQRISSMEIRLANWRYAVKDDNAYRQAVLHGAPRLWLYDPSEEANKAARAIIEDARREQLARAEFLAGLPSAHAERNRDHGHQRETGLPDPQTQGKAQVFNKRLQPCNRPLLPRRFARHRQVAELISRRGTDDRHIHRDGAHIQPLLPVEFDHPHEVFTCGIVHFAALAPRIDERVETDGR